MQLSPTAASAAAAHSAGGASGISGAILGKNTDLNIASLQALSLSRDEITARGMITIGLGGQTMKSFIRNALFGAAGLVAWSLPAHALGTTSVTDTAVFKAETVQLARQYSRSWTDDGYGRTRDTAAGSVGFKKSKKKAPAK